MFTLKLVPPGVQRPSIEIANALRHAAEHIQQFAVMPENHVERDRFGNEMYQWTTATEETDNRSVRRSA